ncbi:MAG: hypothetical protein R3F17_02760 [Planctomycetota bacterium]
MMADAAQQFVQIHRLVEVVAGARAHRVYSVAHIGVGGEHHHRRVARPALQLLKELHSAHTRHAHVEQHEIDST